MIGVHACLEQNMVPDGRMNGASLRFWEAQYDVMIRANFMNSPHGWSAWTAYAKYYLYLLTGKENYLLELLNLMGACVQLMDLNGNLRWAFAADPQICAEIMAPDHLKPIKDGYKNIVASCPAYRGKYIQKVFGEEYIDVISDWYRIGDQLITGGYETCPFIDKNNRCVTVDNQGGACDNDVHEIFKCLEETVLKKAFFHECGDGRYICSSCRMDGDICVVNEEAEQIYFCLKSAKKIVAGGYIYELRPTDGAVFVFNLTDCSYHTRC